MIPAVCILLALGAVGAFVRAWRHANVKPDHVE